MSPVKTASTYAQALSKVALIKRVIATHFHITPASFAVARGPERISWPRQIAMSLAREMTSLTFNQIGESFGGRDHATVINALHRVNDRYAAYPHDKASIDRVKQLIREQIGE